MDALTIAITIIGLSFHSGPINGEKPNGWHEPIGVEYLGSPPNNELPNLRAGIGIITFKNSYKHYSRGVTSFLTNNGFGARLSFVDGYEEINPDEAIPALYPIYRSEGELLIFEAGFMPHFLGKGVHVITGTIGIGF